MEKLWWITYYEVLGEDKVDIKHDPTYYHSEEDAQAALRKKRVTPKHPQYNLVTGYIDRYGCKIEEERLLVKDDAGIYEP